MATITFSRLQGFADSVDYLVHEDGVERGLVARYGHSAPYVWAGLAHGAPAWGPVRRTRKEATADLLAGITFRDYERR